jgi:hypothetical protein
LNLLERNVVACDIPVHVFLVQGISELYDYIVYVIGKSWCLHEFAKPFILLLAGVDFCKHHNVVLIKQPDYGPGSVFRLRFCDILRHGDLLENDEKKEQQDLHGFRKIWWLFGVEDSERSEMNQGLLLVAATDMVALGIV